MRLARSLSSLSISGSPSVCSNQGWSPLKLWKQSSMKSLQRQRHWHSKKDFATISRSRYWPSCRWFRNSSYVRPLLGNASISICSMLILLWNTLCACVKRSTELKNTDVSLDTVGPISGFLITHIGIFSSGIWRCTFLWMLGAGTEAPTMIKVVKGICRILFRQTMIKTTFLLVSCLLNYEKIHILIVQCLLHKVNLVLKQRKHFYTELCFISQQNIMYILEIRLLDHH